MHPRNSILDLPLTFSVAARATSTEAAVDALHEQGLEDFRVLRVHSLDGWTLSHTELDLAAMLMLLES